MALLEVWNETRHVVVGMLHAPALPGSPGYAGDRPAITDAVLRDAESLVSNGVHGLLLENYGDTPFYPGQVPASVVALMTRLASDVRRRFDVPLGINMLRNDGLAALAVAHAAEASFIRVNVLCGARLTDQGLVQGQAHELLRERSRLGAAGIRILADVDVKHSAPLASRSLEEEAGELAARGGADAVIVSGSGTGSAASVDQLRAVKQSLGRTSVLVGSGITAHNVADYLPWADGFIVGTAVKHQGRTDRPVEAAQLAELMQRLT